MKRQKDVRRYMAMVGSPNRGQSVSAGARMMHTSSLQRTGSAQGITEGGSHLHA